MNPLIGGGGELPQLAISPALAQKQAGSPVKKMSQELYGAIMLYTGNAIYRDLNQVHSPSGCMKSFQFMPFFFSLPGIYHVRVYVGSLLNPGAVREGSCSYSEHKC